MKIIDFLGHGHGAAVTLQHLTRLTGWNEREVRKQIEAARRHGAPIVSDNRRGYWLSDDPAEVEQFVKGMRGRAGEIMRTAAAVERAAGLD